MTTAKRARAISGSSATRLAMDGAKTNYGHVESFSGPGGMSLGLERAGFTLRLAFDIDEPSVKTHCRNLGDKCIVADAATLRGETVLSRIGLSPGELALFAGGPPCQGFSKQKRGAHLGDDRNDLVLEYVRLVKELRPRFFLFENVAIFGQKRGREYLEEMGRILGAYCMTPHFYNSADYGLAQTRERFVIVGRNDQREPFYVPAPTVDKWRTVGEVLRDLPEPPEDYSDHPSFPNHQRARVTPINIKRFSYVPQGGGWQDIPHKMRIQCHQDADPARGGWPDVYGRLEWDGQCPTITGGFDSFTRGRYGHPLYDRPLTPREAARLQGFPDSFVFTGTRADARKQIGNAVPPPVAEILGHEIRRCLEVHDGLREPLARMPESLILPAQPLRSVRPQRRKMQTV
jgi:DNA (cytosine-5)-methyltransferase 1